MPSAVVIVATNPDINSDLTPEALQGDRVPQEGDVTSVPIPPSDVPQAEGASWEPFAEDTPDVDALFEENRSERYYQSPVRGVNRPISASLLAIALADPATSNDITLLSEATLEAARGILDQQQEFNARLQVAAGRQIDTMKYLDNLTRQWQERAKVDIVPEGVQELIQNTYNDVMSRDREQDARTAVEFEAIDRVRGFMTQNDIHEAYLAREAAFGYGTAEKVIVEESTKTLIAMQRLEELEAEYQDSGWIRGFFNGMIRIIPFTDAFSASGILDDAGIANDATSIFNFFARGENLIDQRAALWHLPLDQFAEALAPDGAVMKSIRANADWLMADPTRASELGSILLAHEQPTANLENLFGAVDTAAVIPLGRVTRVLKGLGARSAAVDQTTRAALETINRGAEAAKSATGIGVEELTENLTPSIFMNQQGVSVATDVAAHLKTAEELRAIFPDLMAVHRMDSAEDIKAAFQTYEKDLLENTYGEHVKDIKYVEENIRTGESREFIDDVAEEGTTIYRLEVTLGKKDGGGYSKPSYVEGLFERFGRQGEVIKDPETGQYFGKIQVAVPLDGFITSTLNTPDALFSFLRSSARTADPTAVAKGVVAGNASNRFINQVEQTLKASVKGIPRKERNALTQIIMKGQNEAKWYTEDEFALHYERIHGSYPTAKVQQAYETYRSLHDLTYLVRNDAVYTRKYNMGFESHTFRMGGREVDIDAVVNVDPTRRPLGHRMWDATNDRWLADNISSEEVKAMVDEGYIMLRLDHAVEMPDGRMVDYVMAKRGDVVSRPLRRTQLNYSQGGSRAYDATHFIKQAAEDVDGNLINPRTFIAGRNLNEMKAWADDMNKALDLARAGEGDLLKYADIFRERPGYPTPQEFLDMIEQRQLSLKHNFEVVEDQSMPAAYFNKDPSQLRFVDQDEVALDSYHATAGRMYYGTKGETLKDTTGNFAETIDPWNTLNATITEAAKTYSFAGYKQNMLERFKNTYGAYLDLDNLRQADSLYGIVDAPLRRGTPADIAAKIGQERGAVRRLMNFETEYEKWIRQRWRNAADWVLGDAAATSFRGKTRDAMYWLEQHNPIQFMRTLAFDANLGMWNIGQPQLWLYTVVSLSRDCRCFTQ
jgi:hypothetical protein